MSDPKLCPVCGENATWPRIPGRHNTCRVSGCGCPQYVISRHDLVFLENDEERRKWQPERICALLWEREYKGLPSAFLQFENQDYPDLDRCVPVSVSDLLQTWPSGVSRRIERCLCNLVNYANKNCFRIGQTISVRRTKRDFRLLLTDDNGEAHFFVLAMDKYEWIESTQTSGGWALTITPKGYARYDELERGQAHSKNPVFVATWFGGNDQKEEMTQLFDKHLEVAISRAGYKARRADTDEHNEAIMDRVIEYIRNAPFVVAELSDDNQGVYYEAGFARGLGTEVIYCCSDKAIAKVHFDVSGINLVAWDTHEDLCKKLEDRILGTIGQGPYSSDEL